MLSRDAEELYREIASLPIVSPHGHTVPAWFSDNQPFADPAALLIVPDHYIFRLLYSQGVPMQALGIGQRADERDSRAIFRCFAAHWHLLLGTPSREWLTHTLEQVFGIDERLGPDTADAIHDAIATALADDAFRPRALLQRFDIEVLATTDGALDTLEEHASFQAAKTGTRLLPTFRPDALIDPAAPGFIDNVHELGESTGEDTARWSGYLAALRARRAHFIAHGATATDHAVLELATDWLDTGEAQRLLDRSLSGSASVAERARLHNHLLIEMAQMSSDDGLVMQLHVGSRRSTNRDIAARFGTDMGADIPRPVDWVGGLDALLNRVGNDASLGIIAFTLDESGYARELAPMAGHWPALRLGPPWWFHDSPNGIARYFDRVVETAGYFNLAGFNDDTRALMSIPARHDMWRRAVSQHLADQVARQRFDLSDARTLAHWLAVGAARDAYRLDAAAIA